MVVIKLIQTSTRHDELKEVLKIIQKNIKSKKVEYHRNSVYDLRVLGKVRFLIILEKLHWKDYSSLNFQVNPSGRAHFLLKLLTNKFGR